MGGGSGREIPIFISTPAIVMAGKILTKVKRIAPQKTFSLCCLLYSFPTVKSAKML
jgi:hypothetical protein